MYSTSNNDKNCENTTEPTRNLGVGWKIRISLNRFHSILHRPLTCVSHLMSQINYRLETDPVNVRLYPLCYHLSLYVSFTEHLISVTDGNTRIPVRIFKSKIKRTKTDFLLMSTSRHCTFTTMNQSFILMQF